ncbi:MAG: VPLPA-CTERM sorting domain-containing protein [Boseongicola sp.]
MKLFKHALAASAISMLATSAWSASYSFNLAADGDPIDPGTETANSFSISDGDMTGSFTGRYIDNPGYDGMMLNSGNINDAYQLRRWSLGAGIYNVSTNDQHTVDGKGYHDFVEMAFTFMGSAVDVTLTSLSFGWFGGGYSGPINSSFELIVDSTGNATIDLGDMKEYAGEVSNSAGNGPVSVSGFGLSANDVFGVMAGENGSWKLNAVTVEYTPDVPEIPLPAGIWLMLGGLGGLAAVRRR